MHHLTMVPLVMESPIDGTFMVSWARMGYVVDTAQRWKVIGVIIVVVVIGRAGCSRPQFDCRVDVLVPAQRLDGT
jgi:hypothetical protein